MPFPEPETALSAMIVIADEESITEQKIARVAAACDVLRTFNHLQGCSITSTKTQ
jgi:hypothetical protein